MMNTRARTRVAVLLLTLAAASPWSSVSAISGIPDSGSLGFTVLRNGNDVGKHTIHFTRGDDGIKVDVQTRVNVKLPLIGVSVYHFEHEGHELWRDGALVALGSVTDDDGAAHELEVRREGQRLRVTSNGSQHESAGDLIPASLWHPDLVKRSLLLNTLDGREMPVSVTEQPGETVQVRGRTVNARHFVVSGGLERELWYDADGVLVKVAFAAKDDSRIEYVLE